LNKTAILGQPPGVISPEMSNDEARNVPKNLKKSTQEPIENTEFIIMYQAEIRGNGMSNVYPASWI
jgi:hypothetical protein